MSEPVYDAFISYRRRDGSAVAQWLRRELESFRPPRALRSSYPRRLLVYLDVAYERGTSDFYTASIRPALLASRWLIVVATPEAARGAERAGDWIAREIGDFCAGPNGSNVMAARGAGGFTDPLPGPLDRLFPQMEIVDLRGAGRFWRLNPHRAVRLSGEKLKLVATLVDLPPTDMPRLRQEEEARQQVRIGAALGATSGVLAAVSALSILALQSRNQAIRALEDSMYASGSMLLAAQGLPKGDKEDGQIRVRQRLINQGCDMIDKLSGESGVEPAIREAVSCRLERARSREELKEVDEARRGYQDALAIALDRYGRTGRIDAAERALEAHASLSEFLVRQGRSEEAGAEVEARLRDARRFGADHPTREPFMEAEATACAQLAGLAAGTGNRAEAAVYFDDAAKAAARLVEVRGKRPRGALELLTGYYRSAGQARMELGDVAEARRRLVLSVEAAGRLPTPEDSPSDPLQSQAVAYAYVWEIERRAGHAPEAEAARTASLALLDRVLAARESSEDLKSKARGLRTYLLGQTAPAGATKL